MPTEHDRRFGEFVGGYDLSSVTGVKAPSQQDPTNPDYYRDGGIETADFIAAKGLDFFEGNAVKYVTRWRQKGGVEDLRKARWYINKLIEMNDA